jgi:hypothetical protein
MGSAREIYMMHKKTSVRLTKFLTYSFLRNTNFFVSSFRRPIPGGTSNQLGALDATIYS